MRIEIRDPSDAAVLVGQNLLDHALGAQLAVLGGERFRDHGVVRAALGVHFAGESHAPAATHAGGTAVVWHAVAQHGNVERVEAEPFGGRMENFVFAVRRQRRHGQGLAARSVKWVARNVARNADFPFGLFVIRLEILIRDRPIGERAAGDVAVGRAHAEIFFHIAPRHRAIAESPAAHARRIVLIAGAAGACEVFAALQINGHARIAFVVGSEAVP